MDLVRRLAIACLAALALATPSIGVGAGADGLSVTEQIFRDYALDRVIDGRYGAADLNAALELARGDAAFREFADAVQEAYDRDILGLSTDPERRPIPAPTGQGGLPFLPEPRPPGERDQPPWPFLALTALAGALVLSGAGSSILRRARR